MFTRYDTVNKGFKDIICIFHFIYFIRFTVTALIYSTFFDNNYRILKSNVVLFPFSETFLEELSVIYITITVKKVLKSLEK